jgi:uncharacterized protein (DUF924 family)
VENDIADIHQFWFGQLDENGLAAPQQQRLWFSATAETDAELGERFGALVSRGLSGELESWAGDDDDGLVALILLLDQFTRNIYRGTPRAFAGDSIALELAGTALAADRQRAMPAIHRVFLYLPLEHSEDLALQEECVRLFTELAHDNSAVDAAGFTRYAIAHRDVIARFGRFPHRNAILGRTSTTEELDYLQQHGGF